MKDAVLRLILSFFTRKSRKNEEEKPHASRRKKKIFEKNQGEYVDYEEVEEKNKK